MAQKKHGLQVVFLLTLLACCLGAKTASAQNCTPGIAEGDSFVFDMFAEYTSSNPNATVEVPAFEANNTDWVRIDITDVNASVISQRYTLHYKNGTEQVFDGQTNLADNSSYMQESNGFRGVPICPADLNVGDSLQTLQLTVNETVTWMFPSGPRQVNHVFWNSSLELGDVYFDRQTGVLVDMYRQHAFINEETGEVVKNADIIKMQSSSLWTIPEFPDSTFLAIAASAIAVTAFMYRRSLREKKQYD
jgi:hypothetical protein